MRDELYMFGVPVEYTGIDKPSAEFMAAQIATRYRWSFSPSTGCIMHPNGKQGFDRFADFVDFCAKNGFFLSDRSGVNWPVVEQAWLEL